VHNGVSCPIHGSDGDRYSSPKKGGVNSRCHNIVAVLLLELFSLRDLHAEDATVASCLCDQKLEATRIS